MGGPKVGEEIGGGWGGGVVGTREDDFGGEGVGGGGGRGGHMKQSAFPEPPICMQQSFGCHLLAPISSYSF